MEDTKTLFIGDLSVYCSEADVESLFGQFGPIDKITIKRSSAGNTNLSYGFIKFQKRESAESAIRMNGFMFLGRAMRIGWAGPRSPDKPIKPKEGPRRTDTAQIHVSFISKQVDNLITEETLRFLFNRFGPVVDVTIKKSKLDAGLKVQNGYGFIHYPLTCEGIQAAVNATREVHQVTMDRVTYDCTLSHLLESYLTPEQIAYAYCNGDATSSLMNATKRMTERKRQQPQQQKITNLISEHSKKSAKFAPNHGINLPGVENFSVCANDAPYSELDEYANNSWYQNEIKSEDCNFASFRFVEPRNHRRSSSNESSINSIESAFETEESLDSKSLFGIFHSANSSIPEPLFPGTDYYVKLPFGHQDTNSLLTQWK